MKIEKTCTVSATLEQVWAAMIDWGGVWKFQPFVVRSPLLSAHNEGVGAARRCEFSDNTSIVETVTAVDAPEITRTATAIQSPDLLSL